MKKYILIALLPIIFIACDVAETDFFRSYVTEYNRYEISLYSDTDKTVSPYGIIRIYSKKGSFHTYNWKSKGKNKLVFDSLCRVHNDMSYNKEISYIKFPHWGHCFYYDIASIDVVSEEDFDKNHKKGSSLKDVIHFRFHSLKEFIDAGYQPKYSSIYGNKEAVFYDKKLSEIGTNEMIMLEGHWTGSFVFDTAPTLSKTHHLTFTFHYTNGETYTAKVVKEFK